MHPVIVQFGPVTLYSYGVLLVAGFLAATWWAASVAGHGPRTGPPGAIAGAGDLYVMTAEQVVDCSCLMLLCGILGGRLFYLALYWRAFLKAPWEIIAIWHGGLVFYGGLLGGLAGAWWYTQRHRLDVGRAFDQMTPFAILGHAFGRLGCFFNGCCYGKPTDAWCGIWFPGHESAVYPTQLFEAGGLLILCIALRYWQVRGGLARRWAIFAEYLIGYGLLRLGVEFLRGDKGPVFAGLTLMQLLSLGLIVVGLVLLLRSSSLPHGAHVPLPRRRR